MLVKLGCQDTVGCNVLGAGGTLMTFEFAREKEEAIVAHEVMAGVQLDKLHCCIIQLRHLLLLCVKLVVVVAF